MKIAEKYTDWQSAFLQGGSVLLDVIGTTITPNDFDRIVENVRRNSQRTSHEGIKRDMIIIMAALRFTEAAWRAKIEAMEVKEVV